VTTDGPDSREGRINHVCLYTRVRFSQSSPSRTETSTKRRQLVYTSPHHQRCRRRSSTLFSSTRPRHGGSRRGRSDVRARWDPLLPDWITRRRGLIATRRPRQADHRRLMRWINNGMAGVRRTDAEGIGPRRPATARDAWYIAPRVGKHNYGVSVQSTLARYRCSMAKKAIMTRARVVVRRR